MVKFHTNLILFWLQGQIDVDERQVKTKIPNTIFFGLIPLGSNDQTIPLSNISGVEISGSYKLFNIIVGVVLFLVSFGMFSESVLGALVCMVIGALLVVSGVKSRMTIEKAGKDWIVNVPIWSKKALQEAHDQILQALAYTEDKRDGFKTGAAQVAMQQQFAAQNAQMQAQMTAQAMQQVLQQQNANAPQIAQNPEAQAVPTQQAQPEAVPTEQNPQQ